MANQKEKKKSFLLALIQQINGELVAYLRNLGSRRVRYLGMTAAIPQVPHGYVSIPQVPVPTAMPTKASRRVMMVLLLIFLFDNSLAIIAVGTGT